MATQGAEGQYLSTPQTNGSWTSEHAALGHLRAKHLAEGLQQWF